MRTVSALLTAAILFCSAAIYAQNKSGAKPMNNISDISVKNIDGKKIKLSDYNGKVLLIVNTASECGNTPQYKDLQSIYEKYKDQGLEILAFPSNDFGGQEPGSTDEIKAFCTTEYGVTFPLFDKVKVLGENKNPLYARLTNNTNTEQGEVKWNFEKFLVSKDGTIVKRFTPKTLPTDEKVVKSIEKELKK